MKQTMKNPIFLAVDDQGSRTFWWREAEEFDESRKFKVVTSEISGVDRRLRVVREMERLGFVAGEGLDDVRQKLVGYRAGDFWLPIGGISKDEMDIPPVVTVLLTGFVGCGKSSLVNLMYSVLGRSGLIPFAQTSGESSNESTMYLEEHNVLRSQRSGFCVYDTRGVDPARMEEGLSEVSMWMSEGVRHRQPCSRSGDDEQKLRGSTDNSIANCRYVKRKVNCVMVVADLAQIHSADFKSVAALRALFHLSALQNTNENPILILTHGDTLSVEDRISGRLRVCEHLGIPETNGAYDIPCLTEQGILAEESDPVTAFALAEAVYRALLQADRSHLPKRKLKDHMIVILSWIMWCIASFFAGLANFFSRFGHQKTKLKT